MSNKVAHIVHLTPDMHDQLSAESKRLRIPMTEITRSALTSILHRISSLDEAEARRILVMIDDGETS